MKPPMAGNGRVDVSGLVGPLARQFSGLAPGPLRRYLGEIAAWNDQIGLVSKRATTAVLEKLVRRSAQLFDFIDGYGFFRAPAGPPRIVDVGSGGGFPGIIWKIIRPEIELVLVERRIRKAAFLARIVVILGFDGVEIVEKDAAEAMALTEMCGRFDLAVTMAMGPPAEVARLVEGFLKPEGYYCTVRPHEDATQPTEIGKRLRLKRSAAYDQSLFCLYQMEK